MTGTGLFVRAVVVASATVVLAATLLASVLAGISPDRSSGSPDPAQRELTSAWQDGPSGLHALPTGGALHGAGAACCIATPFWGSVARRTTLP
jgi:hypothetical protein